MAHAVGYCVGMLATVSTLVVAGGGVAATASAPVVLDVTPTHGPGSGGTVVTVSGSGKHAAEDLANISMKVIEKQTAANRARIFATSGVEPGAARSAKVGSVAPTFSAAAVSADPGRSGQWSSVVGTDVVPVFQALLPDGKILMWDSVGDNATETYPDQSFTRAAVWNPADDTSVRVDVPGANIFCAGFAHLPNGNILVAGGNADQDLNGLIETHIFNWRTETWSRGPDMAAGRWYPAVAEMANGEGAIVGGGADMAEVYQTNGKIRALRGFTDPTYGGRSYPYMISRPDTQLGLVGPYDFIIDVITAGTGAVSGSDIRDGIKRSYGSFATYDIGKELVVGGGSLSEDGLDHVPTKTAVVLNSNSSVVPTVSTTGSMSVGRRQFNATVMADGSVLATGGETSAANSGLVDLDNAVTAAERWDPSTGAWTVLGSAERIRQYHSSALLLPDGQVMTGGGGICGVCMKVGYLEKNVEYFAPPYLFKHDGSGELAPRPEIASAPATVKIHATFQVTSPQAARIKKVALVGLSDVTHDANQGQRYVPLKHTVSGTTLTVTGPPNGGVTPPGYYMLFLIDADGVPSMANIVSVAKGPTPLMSPVKNTGAVRCMDVPSSSLALKTYLQSYSCNNTKAQAFTRLPNDSTLRVLGNCVAVPSANYVSGQRVWTYKCSSATSQKWQFRSDGTIRPTGKTTLCLTAASTAQSARLTISTCSGSSLQKWTW